MLLTKVGKSDREGTFAVASGNDEDAPIAAVRAFAPQRGGSTLTGRSPALLDDLVGGGEVQMKGLGSALVSSRKG
jgi:hypothetical protein